MLKVTLICILVSISFIEADHHDHHNDDDSEEYRVGTCSPADAAMVQEEWNAIWASLDPSWKVELARNLLLEVVKEHPEAKDLFKNVGIDNPMSGEFSAHSLRIFNSFDLLVKSLSDRNVLHDLSEHLGRQHAERPGVLGRYFETFIRIAFKDAELMTDYKYISSWRKCVKAIYKNVFAALPY